MKKIIIVSNTVWSLVNFRSGIIKSLLSLGYNVVAVAPPDKYLPKLKALGCHYRPLLMNGRGINPFNDLFLLFKILKLFIIEKPDIYMAYTIKPNIYGTLIARILKIPTINNITGLGTVFDRTSWVSFLVQKLYKISLKRSNRVFFQNEDDKKFFIQNDLVLPEKVYRIPGSGVDINRFKLLPVHNQKPFRFLMFSRMIWKKGVGEYIEAAKIIKKEYTDVEFCLLGHIEPQGHSSISKGQIDQWATEGIIRYLGVSDNIRVELSQANCAVLPSYYREGVPRSLLEASSMGLPIITTDSVGCRDVVDNGVNGFLCLPRDANDMAEKMKKMLSLSEEKRMRMGFLGAEKIKREFDEKIVINEYLKSISHITHQGSKMRNNAIRNTLY